ncbi:hypothetical protein N658DRAFT_332478 [Parathielavia hyrcaniae]|uniref:Uncharacterized protein n=1 Tax=Parathielavia hyrcaniae TaxID=113614 RepID=A0AAN6SXU8_9PEZI|nr:hypothetical protein N658DRAFT_332478 [Parathielavia hyrcaniae]
MFRGSCQGFQSGVPVRGWGWPRVTEASAGLSPLQEEHVLRYSYSSRPSPSLHLYLLAGYIFVLLQLRYTWNMDIYVTGFLFPWHARQALAPWIWPCYGPLLRPMDLAMSRTSAPGCT